MVLLSFAMTVSLTRSTAALNEQTDLIRAYTRAIEFDFVSWTLKALDIKLGQAVLGASRYLSEATRKQTVLDYIELIRQIDAAERELYRVYADPQVGDPEAASVALRTTLDGYYERRSLLGPLAEAIVQEQISTVITTMELDFTGQTLPPVLYHTTKPPYALIVSPRDRIEQVADISISPDITIDKQALLEAQVDEAQNVSSLVVGIGGIGLYPTMVMQTSDLNWLMEVVSHEWTHNYLTLHPLGLNYYTTPELRIINETTASIAGKEIGRAVIERYYPEWLPPPPTPPSEEGKKAEPSPDTPAPFDFRAAMHETRVTVDQMLAEGNVEEAEAYMAERRQMFLEHGYGIRKLNQAYFAFYGAYADQPGGAAGEDPVSAAVRTLRTQSPSLTDFINRIMWVTSFEQLQEMTQEP